MSPKDHTPHTITLNVRISTYKFGWWHNVLHNRVLNNANEWQSGGRNITPEEDIEGIVSANAMKQEPAWSVWGTRRPVEVKHSEEVREQCKWVWSQAHKILQEQWEI